jgi:hypothetical protein
VADRLNRGAPRQEALNNFREDPQVAPLRNQADAAEVTALSIALHSPFGALAHGMPALADMRS